MKTVPRLYKQFQPSHYSLSLNLRRQDRVFAGEVTISGHLSAKSSKAIYLHAKGLDIHRVKINNQTASFSHDGDILGLSLKGGDLPMGEYQLELKFSGVINDPMHGIYPCYFEDDGIKKELLATQFESHHAREAFPCIDEPEAKATFDLTLTTETGVTALSNMPTLNSEETKSQLTTVFETSPRMSTYLLAFVVGDLHSVSAQTKSGTKVNVWATPNRSKKSLEFALDTSVKAIDFFDDYFGIPYPLSKCDHVALPDFSSGAMENWGLITYREVCLLVDQHTSTAVKEYVATVICHELSHQWFGNLVTMQWWDDLWLNESFATLMEYVAVDALYPDWDVWTTFTASEGLSALKRDALPGVQAVKTPVHHPDEISSLFDPSIVYAKGARLLNMLLSFIGEEQFRTGLKRYFKAHAYANTTGDDLWRALSPDSLVSDFMKPWLTQAGYPVLSVSQKGTQLQLSQTRLVISDKPVADSRTWPVPLLETKKRDAELITKASDRQTLSDGEFRRYNKEAGGHYAVHYLEPAHQKFIQSEISRGALSASERLAFINDSSLLSQAGLIRLGDNLKALAAYKNEPSEPVWSAVIHQINETKRLVETDTELETKFKAFILQLITPSLVRLGWDPSANESNNDTKLRALMIGLSIYCDYKPSIDKSLEVYNGIASLDKLPVEIRSSILNANVRFGSKEVFNELLAAYPKIASSELQQDIIAGLAATRNLEQVEKLLEQVTDSEIVRAQEVDHWLIYLLRNRWARPLAWHWLVDNWGWIETKFKSDKSYDNYPRYAAACMSTDEWLKKYRDFFEPLEHEAALTRNIQIGIKEISARIAWSKRELPGLKEFLSAQDL